MDKSLRILIVWELGAHLGHIGRLAPVAQELLKRGHQVTLLVPDVNRVRGHVADHPRLKLAECPGVKATKDFAPASYAALIKSCVLPDDDAATQLAATWRRLLADARPDVMLAEHAPGALLAARLHQLPVLHLADGWGLPLVAARQIGRPQLPLLRPVTPGAGMQALKDAAALESELVERANVLLRQAGASVLEGLGDLYSGAAVSLLGTFPELDHFGARPDAKYVGASRTNAKGLVLKWSDVEVGTTGAARKKRVFVYLQPDPGNIFVLRALQNLGLDVIAYLPKVKPEAVSKISSAQVQVSTEPIRIDRLLQDADLVVSNGGHGLLCQSLLAGVPLIVLPTQREQVLLALRAQQSGAVLVLGRKEIKEKFFALAQKVLDGSAHRAAAAAFAEKYKTLDGTEVIRKLANTLEKLGLPPANNPPALTNLNRQPCQWCRSRSPPSAISNASTAPGAT